MKVLLYDTTHAFLTPGGKMTHALKLQQEISKKGIDIQFSQWWNKEQEDADIIHFLCADLYVAKLAKQKGMKTFFSCIFDYESNKSPMEQKKAILKYRIKDMIPAQLGVVKYWKAFEFMDCIQFMHVYDRNTALRYFPHELSLKKTIIIPHAYDPADMFISGNENVYNIELPDKYLVSVANISERKQTLKLASLAKKAEVPIVFLGSRNLSDPYFKEFAKMVDNKYVIYPGFVSKECKDYIEKNASGYVLLSKGESGCIAVYEAAAYKLPLLLSNLPWAWGYEKPTDIHFFDDTDNVSGAKILKDFFLSSNKLDHMPFEAHTWGEIADLYINEYKKLLL